MANLNEFIGSIVSNISQSRANADKQTIEIAKEYAKDNLLKHFAVPRFRVDTVELTIPVAINGYSNNINNTSLDSEMKEARKSILSLTVKHLAVEGIAKDFVATIETEIQAQLQKLFLQNLSYSAAKKTETCAINIANNFGNWLSTVYKSIKKKLPTKADVEKMQEEFRINVASVLQENISKVTSTTNLHNLDVIVESSKLREINTADKIMITMKISEQGMEWIKMENDNGQSETRLLPE